MYLYIYIWCNEKGFSPTIAEWHTSLVTNGGSSLPVSKGHYQREGVLWHHEELCEAARDCVHQRSTKHDFNYLLTNEHLLPNSVLCQVIPDTLVLKQCKKVLDKKNSIYIDGHE